MASTKNPLSAKRREENARYVNTTHVDYSDISERLKRFKDSLGLTFGDWSEQTKINPSTLNNCCTGAAVPAIVVMRIMKKKYGLSYDWLIDEEGDMISETNKSEEDRMINSLLKKHDADILIDSMEKILSRLKRAKKAAMKA